MMLHSRSTFWRAAGLVVRLAIGVVFLYAGFVKLRQPWYIFAGMIDNYGVVSPTVSEWLARILPAAELVLGVLLLAGWYRRTASFAAATLLSAFCGLMLWGYLKGLRIDCGCFGPGEAVGPRTLLRDGVLVAGSISLMISSWLAGGKPRRTPLREFESSQPGITDFQ